MADGHGRWTLTNLLSEAIGVVVEVGGLGERPTWLAEHAPLQERGDDLIPTRAVADCFKQGELVLQVHADDDVAVQRAPSANCVE